MGQKRVATSANKKEDYDWHLAEMTTLAPSLAAATARAAPIPVLAPVTQTTWDIAVFLS